MNQLITFIKENIEDFKSGVNGDYLDNIDIGYNKLGIQKKLNELCEVKRHKHKLPDGKYKYERIYTLKEDFIDTIMNTEELKEEKKIKTDSRADIVIKLDAFIKEHVNDFINGVESDYLDKIDFACKNTIQRLLYRVCEVKRKQHKDKRTRLYKLKDCWISNYDPEYKVEKKSELVEIEGRTYKDVKVDDKYLITVDAPYIIRKKKTMKKEHMWIDCLSGKSFVKLSGKEYLYSELIE